MYEKNNEQQLLIVNGQTAGDFYLKGFADGYYDRPRVKQSTKAAQDAYTKGYEFALAQQKENNLTTDGNDTIGSPITQPK